MAAPQRGADNLQDPLGGLTLNDALNERGITVETGDFTEASIAISGPVVPAFPALEAEIGATGRVERTRSSAEGSTLQASVEVSGALVLDLKFLEIRLELSGSIEVTGNGYTDLGQLVRDGVREFARWQAAKELAGIAEAQSEMDAVLVTSRATFLDIHDRCIAHARHRAALPPVEVASMPWPAPPGIEMEFFHAMMNLADRVNGLYRDLGDREAGHRIISDVLHLDEIHGQWVEMFREGADPNAVLAAITASKAYFLETYDSGTAQFRNELTGLVSSLTNDPNITFRAAVGVSLSAEAHTRGEEGPSFGVKGQAEIAITDGTGPEWNHEAETSASAEAWFEAPGGFKGTLKVGTKDEDHFEVGAELEVKAGVKGEDVPTDLLDDAATQFQGLGRLGSGPTGIAENLSNHLRDLAGDARDGLREGGAAETTTTVGVDLVLGRTGSLFWKNSHVEGGEASVTFQTAASVGGEIGPVEAKVERGVYVRIKKSF